LQVLARKGGLFTQFQIEIGLFTQSWVCLAGPYDSIVKAENPDVVLIDKFHPEFANFICRQGESRRLVRKSNRLILDGFFLADRLVLVSAIVLLRQDRLVYYLYQMKSAVSYSNRELSFANRHQFNGGRLVKRKEV
jgi:hypothetical protein